jgi:hypothetical protein
MLRLRQALVSGPLLIALLPWMFYLLVLAAYASSLLRYPFDYDQGEGFELYDGIRLARGENIYLDNSRFPFYASNYPPVYRAMLVPFIWLFGPHLAVGRAVTLACTLAISAMIYLAALHQQEGRLRWLGLSPGHWLALIVALSFLGANYIYQIAPLARAHMPMVMFAFAGVALIERAFARRATGRALFWGVFCLMLAGFTKLQAVDAMAAGFAYYLIRQPLAAIKSALACAAVCGLVALGLNALTAGQFWLNVVAANVNEYDIGQTWFVYDQWWKLQGVMISLSALFVLWDVARAFRARSVRPITIWSMWAITGAAMGMLTGKWGAGPAYLIGGMAAQCVCVAGLFHRLAQPGAINRRIGVYAAAGVLLTVQAYLNFHTHTSGRFFGPASQAVAALMGRDKFPTSYAPYGYYDSIGYTQLGHVLDPNDAFNAQKISDAMRAMPGPVLSEEAMFTLRAGKGVITNPTQLYNLSKADMLDTRELIGMINRKEFSAVLFRAQFYPKDVLGAIGQNYRWPEKSYQLNGFDYWLLLPQ